MKHKSQLRRRRPEVTATVTHPSTAVRNRRHFPPPDPSTRVELNPASSPELARRHGGELIVAAGFGAIILSACSKFVQLIDLPSLSEVAVAALGAALAVVGLLKHRGWRTKAAAREAVVAPQAVEVDLPSLTGQLSTLLAQLRQQHGVVYRTRTWIEVVLPGAGADLNDPMLARDLLAAAALDAGGVRADVAGLAESHSRDEIVATISVVIGAVQRVLAACEQSIDGRAPRPSDQSCWPASVC